MYARGRLRMLKRSALAGALRASRMAGLDRIVAARYRGAGCILAFHSVVDDLERQLGQSIHVHHQALRDIVMFLRSSGTDIVTLDEAMQRLERPGSRAFTVLTFDDGYRNNMTLALPVLETLDAPFTVYANSAMLDGTLEAWWLALRNMLVAENRVEIEAMGMSFSCESLAEKRAALLMIADWVHRDVLSHSSALKATFSRYGVDAARIARDEALDWTELRRLAAHRLVTIGGHAETHLPLSGLPEEVARAEVVGNKRALEQAVEREVRHFAYPFGGRNAAGQREASIAEEAGYSTAVTARIGGLFSVHAALRFLLPRLTIVNGDGIPELAAKMAGVERLLRHPFESPVAAL